MDRNFNKKSAPPLFPTKRQGAPNLPNSLGFGDPFSYSTPSLFDLYSSELSDIQNELNEGEELPSWNQYFDHAEDITLPNDLNKSVNTIRVYIAGNSGPILLFLHGAGHTSMSWSLVSDILREDYRIAAYDCRGHGLSVVSEFDLSTTTLVEDASFVLKWVQNYFEEKHNSSSIPIFVIGHSMGGAIATQLAASKPLPNLKGVAVIDIVEGTALQALPFMLRNLKNFPSSFDSPFSAIKWAIKHRLLANLKSAKISIPSQLKQINEKEWVWRCPLENTSGFWKGWFTGISKSFLQADCAKLLICVGHDRLDTEMTRAHMQGKFKLVLIEDSGHTIGEDQPIKVASHLKTFINWNTPRKKTSI